MILTCSEMRATEERAFREGATPECLMDEAGEQIARAVRQFFPTPGVALVFFGKGHNGGDALVAARHLGECGWKVHVIAAYPEDKWSDLTRKKFGEAGRCLPNFPSKLTPRPHKPIVALDGLLGIGAAGPLREPILRFTRTINSLRNAVNAHVFALDLPTGLDGDSGEWDKDAVIADTTLTVGFGKAGLIPDGATDHVGRIAVLPVGPLSTALEPRTKAPHLAVPSELAPLLTRRLFDSHKGDYGRVGIVAGSKGMTGAAVMTSAACVRAGAGLVTVYATPDCQPVLASRAIPEVMVRPVESYQEVLQQHHNVLALGPGLGESRSEEVHELLAQWEGPMIVDADGLNILAKNRTLLSLNIGPRLLTPHPGEMARLDPESKSESRRAIVEEFVAANPVTLLLKGSRTIVGERGRPISYNTTGNPGMASGGMGDVLTGVCAALACRGLSLYDAGRLGSWLCGRAAELAISHGSDSEESLCATGVIDHLGTAFRDLQGRCF